MIKSRSKTIPIRYATPSRREIYVIVGQLRDEMGHWLVPTITLPDNIQQMIESGRYAKDVAIALLVASFWYDDWMLDVKGDLREAA